VIASGPTKTSVRLHSGVQCDLRVVTNAEFPFALAYFTGSKEHNIQLRARALKHGWTLNEYRFTPTSPDSPPVPDEIYEERDLHRSLGLDYIDPALREGSGEIEAAEAGTLPLLVELENLRGTFHNHTTASDGHASLRQMAEAAMELGLEYLGIADHSKSSFQANGLDETRLRAQFEEIRALNAEYAPDFRLFAGSEVDILKDGSLDFPDDLLAELDYTVASVHNVFNLPEAEMTARILRAVENPHVTMLGHLTGRLLLKREGYAVNHSKIIDCAAETRTIIELNCSPMRLDMDWRWWKRARDKGVLCSINPDAHFGREKYQRWLVLWAQEPRPAQTEEAAMPDDGKDHHNKPAGFARFLKEQLKSDTNHWGEPERAAALKGILGMMRFADFDNPLLQEALGDVLLSGDWETNSMTNAAFAYRIAASKAVDAGEKQRLFSKFTNATGVLGERWNPKKVGLEVKSMLEKGKTLSETVRRDEIQWAKTRKDLSVEFIRKYIPKESGL
jgi:histidinol phosphatase-like PHP family hydrolase